MMITRAISLCLTLLCSMSLFASTYSVNDLGDASDQTAGDDVCATAGAVCTLRAAIEEANAHAGADVIIFGVAGTITPGTLLPAMTQQAAIDGTIAPGYLGTPTVILNGGGSIATGLTLAAGSSSSEIQGLKIHGFTDSAISIASANVVVRRNYLGPIGGGIANQWGILTLPSSAACTIGGIVDGEGNVISGNSDSGLMIGGSDHTIADNFIGTNASGSAALANGQSGIDVDAVNITIGVIGAGIENLISGNTRFGVFLHGSSLISPTHIANNIIGLNAAENASLPNGQDGIYLNSGGAVIGSPAGGNVISGNTGYGIEIRGGVAVVQNNIIGLDGTGQTAIGNQVDGILVGAPSTIGGTAAAEGNTISANQRNGIGVVSSGGGSTIFGNTIGLNVNRTIARGNAAHGIELNTTFGPDNVQIGTAGGGMNVISGNGQDGINGFATNSSISNNRIGTDGTGNVDLGNAGDGIETDLITQFTSNLISGNGGWGIIVSRLSPNLQGNIIRRNALGGVAVLIDSTTATIIENSIFANTGLGIDLRMNGVTPNDPGDPDTGPDGLQNYAVIASAVTTGGTSWIEGSLNSTPSTSFALHFYSNTSADPSGFGEGETFLGTINVNTDASGNATFIRSGAPLTTGSFITATATGPSGTSEFSAVNNVAPAPTIHFSSATYTTTEAAGVATITVTREGDLAGTSTVDYSTADGTATAGSDYTFTSGTLTFAPGQATATISIPIATDGNVEPDEQFTVTLSNPIGATLTPPSTAVVAIALIPAIPTASAMGLFALMALLAAMAMVKIR
jgi:hypothetical protein